MILKRFTKWLPTHPVTLVLAIWVGGMASIILLFLGGYLLIGLLYGVAHFAFVSPVVTPKEIYIEISEPPAAFEKLLGKSVDFNTNYSGLKYNINLASKTPGSVILKNDANEVFS